MKGFNNFPPTLPASVYGSATGRPTGSPLVRNTTLHVNSPPPIPMRSPVFKGRTVAPVIISPEEYQKYQTFFNQLDTDRTGFVSGQDAVVFFRHSKLPESDLARIWDLADTNSSGMLSEQEFAMAMHMINRKVNGGDIPNTLPTYNIQQQQQPQQRQQQQQQPQQQNVDLLGLSFDAPPLPPPPPQSNIVDLNRSQSNLQTETSRLQNARQQLQKESLVVQDLNTEIGKEKESLSKIKAEADEAERLLEAEKKKKEELTEQLRMYRQETKHFMTRADNAKEEMKRVKSEIEELEKTSNNIKDNQHDVFSLSSGPPLGTSGGNGGVGGGGSGLFAKVNESIIKPHHTGSSLSSTKKEGVELFSKVDDSDKTGPAKTFDPFAGFKASNSSAPSPTLSLNKLKESEQKRPATPSSTNLDISDIESKFPDLNTMEQNFAPAAAASSPAPVPTSPLPKSTGASTNIVSPKKTETTTTTTTPAVSKYGFDLSAFESFGDNTTSTTNDELSSLFTSPTQKKKENDDDFDNIFGNKNSATTTNTTTTGTNFEDIFFK